VYTVHPINILIDNETPFDSIELLSIFKALQDHSTLELSGILPFDDNKDVSALSWTGKPIEVRFSEELNPEKSKNVFWGIITKVTLIKSGQNIQCSLVANSLSIKLDKKKHIRFFQDPNKTYNDVLEHILKSYSKYVKLVDSNSFTSRKIEKMLIQYNETDWEFILRVCRRMQSLCFLADEDSPTKIYLETQKTDSLKIDNFEISKDDESKIVLLELDELYLLGDKLIFLNKDYVIESVKHIFQDNTIISNYQLKSENLNFENSDISNLTGVLLKAKVKDNKDEENLGRIKIEFEGEDLWPNSRYFPLTTSYSSSENHEGVGFFSLPEIDETVLVSFDNSYEDKAIINCVLREKSDKRLADPTHKIWRNRKGREFKITDDNISISANDKYVFIECNDDEIKLINKDCLIKQTKNDVMIEYQNSRIKLNEKNILLQCGSAFLRIQDGKVEITDGKGAKISLNGSLKVEGNEVSIKGSVIKLN